MTAHLAPEGWIIVGLMAMIIWLVGGTPAVVAFLIGASVTGGLLTL